MHSLDCVIHELISKDTVKITFNCINMQFSKIVPLGSIENCFAKRLKKDKKLITNIKSGTISKLMGESYEK